MDDPGAPSPSPGEEKEEAPAAERAAAVQAPAAGRRVLIVDDHEDSAEALRLLIGLWGHEARAAHDGTSALAIAAEAWPEVILLDIGLPGMSGYEVARQLRTAGLGSQWLVAMTGYAREEDRRLALEAGFDEHLVKPVDPDTLRDLLARLPI